MLQSFSFFLLMLLSLQVFAQEAPSLPIPPNTVQVAGDLYIDKTEVANIHWLEFLHFIRQDSGEAYYRQMLPDTLVWAQRNLAKAETSSIDLSNNYLRSEEYQRHPVVGIRYEQALAYARWRSAVVSAMFNRPEELQKMGLAGKRVTVEYRLPTEEEWMQAAAGVLAAEKYPYGHKKWTEKATKTLVPEEAWEQLAAPQIDFKTFKRQLKRAKLPQLHVVRQLPGPLLLAPEFPVPINNGLTNTLGLYHSIGNVAEMVAGTGIAKGGSFMHTLEDSEIMDAQAYHGPAPWLGVRYVATVKIE